MSQQTATAFLEKVENDQELKNELASLGNATIEDVLDIAAAKGFTFSSEDLIEASKVRNEARSEEAGGELSEEELDLVAGGRWGVTIGIDKNSIKVTAWSN